MRMKSLEVYGFKSFADRVKFEFGEGITAIVGPNGCGKSNVFDALRWVMGEQSAKSLRGGEMNDVIFSGTARRKPLGYAEVVVTFDNTDRRLPLDQDEVSIGRRLYRTGESEYYINKELGRLRDVRELLMDTGIGTTSYCFIAQGQIHRLLEANPKERRLVFEEAAGISKYRSRKAKALRKLERVETNLQTLASVRGDADSRLRSITNQARKARRHEKVTGELTEKQVLLALLDYRELTREKAELDEKLARMRECAAAAAARAAAAEARLTEVELTETDLERAASGKEQERARLQTELQHLEDEIRHAESRASELEESCRSARGEIEAQASRFDEDRAGRAAAREAVERIESSFAEEEEALARSNDAARTARAAERELADKVEACRTRAMEAVRRRADTENGLSAAKADVKNHSARAVRLERELSRVDEDYRVAHAASQEAAGSCVQLADRVEAAKRAADKAREEAAALEKRTAGVEELVRRQRAEMDSRRNRLTLLAALHEERQGVAAGAQEIIRAARREEMKFGKVFGVVADLIKVRPEVEVAIEAALGGRSSDIVVDTSRTAARALDFLKEERRGRTFVLPLDSMKETILLPKKLKRHAGVVGRAFDLVEFEPRFRPAVEYLLGRVLVVRDRETAVALARAAGAGTRMVTLDGELVDGNGPYKGGSSPATRPGLVTRKREISRLRAGLTEAGKLLAALSSRRVRIDERLEAARARAESLAGQGRELTTLLAQAKAEQSTLCREEKRLEHRRLSAAAEYDEAVRDRDEAGGRIEKLAGGVEALVGAERAAHEEVERLKAEIERARADRARDEKELADRRAEFAALEEKRAGLSRELESVERGIAERERGLDARREEFRANEARSADLRARAESMRAELSGKSEALEILARETLEARSTKEELRGKLESLREDVRGSHAAHQETQTDMNESRIRESELAMRIEALERNAANELGVSLAEKLAEASSVNHSNHSDHEGDPVDAGALERETEVMRPDDGDDPSRPAEEDAATAPAERLDDVDADELRAAIEALRRKLANIGKVNPYALEEQRELQERSEFLKAQFEDLTKARASLMNVIGRINKKTRVLFRETYDAVRLHFQGLFRKLFGGGKADIVLEGSNDILEAGIEVIARPPGREALKNSLLSGGQKAMTTIALLFAIFRAKPSPFCVLDEVDAPLDDENVDRFCKILVEYTATTQFLVVTHNKATMAYARGALYGVTMQEEGVSRKISIRLADADAHLALDPAAPGADGDAGEGPFIAPSKAA